MYTFVTAVLRKKGINEPYETVNISSMTMTNIFNNYQDGYIHLTNPALSQPTYSKLEQIKQMYIPNTASTFTQWLTAIGTRTIPGSIIKPLHVQNQIKFSDAFQAGFKVQKSHPSDSNLANVYPSSVMTDLYLFKSVGNQSLLHKRVITTVNGLLHINIPRHNGLLVKQGGRTVTINNDNHVGILSFEDIGDVEQTIIKDEWVLPLPENYTSAKYSQAVYLKIDKDLTNKSLLISFCGRFLPQSVYSYQNDGTIRISLHKLDLMQIVLECQDIIDLSSLNLVELQHLKHAQNTESVIDNETILKMLKLMQTFLMIVDTPAITMSQITLHGTGLIGQYEADKNIYKSLPYISGTGILYSYWRQYGETAYWGKHQLFIKNNYYLNAFRRSSAFDNEWENDIPEITHPMFDIGHLLNIQTDYLIYRD